MLVWALRIGIDCRGRTRESILQDEEYHRNQCHKLDVRNVLNKHQALPGPADNDLTITYVKLNRLVL
jgi:hypothetical protein